jgi:hypothetical protein
MNRLLPFVPLFMVSMVSHTGMQRSLNAAQPERRGDWIETLDEETRIRVQTMELTLHPRPEPKPALRYRLIPDPFDRVEGNAALFYLKAMGFLEQTPARDALSDFQRTERQRAQSAEPPETDFPPYSWLNTPPAEFPVDEVKRYLQFISFQPPFMAEAAMRKSFTLDRNIRAVEEPIAYLLPEIQALRELARWQSLRCRLAIRNGDIDAAIAILGQQYALANHLGEDVFIVSNLVGAAISGIAWTDMLYLVQHADAPNLYWALASLPSPLISSEQSLPLERNLLFLQVKTLSQVDETPRPAGYWQDVVERMIPEIRGLGDGFDPAVDPEMERASVVALIAAAYPGAKHYLINVCELDQQLVESFPTTQAVLLAARRYYEWTRDEMFKWDHVPLWQAVQHPEYSAAEKRLRQRSDTIGWAAAPTQLILPAVEAFRIGRVRPQQAISMLQTVEAIRDYAAEHGRLPASLQDLRLPAPLDPFTGAPIRYERNNGEAVLISKNHPKHEYRLILRLAQ